MAVTGKALDLHILARVLSYSRPYKRTFVSAALLTILASLFTLARPLLVRMMLDDYILQFDAIGLLMMTMIMIAVLVGEVLVQFAQTYMANWLGQSVIRDIRVKLYRKIISLRLKFFDRTPIGTLVTRAVSDIETIADIFSQGILTIIGETLLLVLVVGTMLIINWKVTCVILLSIPLLLLATYFFKNAVRAAFQDVRTQVAVLNAFVQEHITGMNIVQIFNREEREFEQFKMINAKHRDAHIRSIWAYSIFFPVVEILSALSVALLVWFGSGQVIAGELSFGDLFAYILYIYMLFRPIRQLADRFNTLQMGMVSSERVFKLLDTESIIEDAGNGSTHGIKGNISFTNVWFAYNDEEWVLKDISFNVNAGETVAFVGATGAGKTSIINVLSRFYEINQGRVTIDDIPIRDLDLNGLRKNVGVVLQDVFLFSDSIYNNITIHDPDISLERVQAAAEAVGAHEFIQRLPGGYHYNVMERGAMLSVGQRQLIAFIRAYVYDPKILVLDEATSSVDTASELLIQNAIGKLTENRTSIVIAHRLSTIQRADKIIVLDHGRIVEQGDHQELLAINGRYKGLFELQFKE